MIDQETVVVKKLSANTIFKICMFSIIPFTIFGIIAGILALFGFKSVTLNNESITGISALLVAPFLSAFVGIIFGLISFVNIVIGVNIMSLIRNTKITYTLRTEENAKDSDSFKENNKAE